VLNDAEAQNSTNISPTAVVRWSHFTISTQTIVEPAQIAAIGSVVR
jgi:hypothetical protein